MQAGRVMLKRLDQLAAERADFAFETTGASRHFGKWIRELRRGGYEFYLVFLWLPSVEFALDRVAARVRLGGHHVDEETVRRRYHAGLRNFFELFQPLATRWQVYDNSVSPGAPLIAAGAGAKVVHVGAPTTWRGLVREYGHATDQEAGGSA